MLVIEDHRTLNDGRILIKTVGGKRFKVRKKSVVQSFIYKLDFEMLKKFYNQEFFQLASEEANKNCYLAACAWYFSAKQYRDLPHHESIHSVLYERKAYKKYAIYVKHMPGLKKYLLITQCKYDMTVNANAAQKLHVI